MRYLDKFVALYFYWREGVKRAETECGIRGRKSGKEVNEITQAVGSILVSLQSY
ncbi:hypothetical protein MUK42_26566 [Musa troglodytarum]|uniref:Uncharacterized protein n=1 Tax=Musa troglodytarum TaxID=320322 RepID=A0A9E7JM86_9LILI|nr:hypothetical protein MUK42_26566 [Musa troglodytarum]